MKTLVISPYHWNSRKPSGIANSLYYLCLALSRFSKVDFLASNVGIEYNVHSSIPNLRYFFYKVFFSEKYLFSFNFYLIYLARIRSCDFVIINEYFSFKSIFVILSAKFFFNKRIYFFPRGSLIRDLNISKRKIIYDKIFIHFFKMSDKVFFTSKYELKKSVAFRNSIILSNCFIPSNLKDIKRESKEKYFLYVNEISRAKGFDFLMSSWKLFYETNPDYQLVVIGHVNDDYSSAFNDHCRSFSDINVRYLGVITGKKKDFYISNALLTLLMSFSENFSNVVIESLSYGVPVVATHGTPWDTLDTYNCGYYIAHDSKLFCKVLFTYVNLSNDDKLLMKNNAQNYFNEHFSFSRFTSTLASSLNI